MIKLPHSKKVMPLIITICIVVVATLFPTLFSEKEVQQLIDAVSQNNLVTPPASHPTETVLPFGLYEVVRVVDGDTIVLRKDREELTVRLIGIDTPESVDPRRSVECFGKEASIFLRETISGRAVSLEKDPSQAEYDRYGRLLAYVFLEDGTHVNKLLLTKGYAYEYTYDTPYKYQEEFKAAQREASENMRGLWSDTTCSGERGN